MVVCANDMADVCQGFEHLLKLEAAGVIEIIEIKNRYREGATSTGYCDANLVSPPGSESATRPTAVPARPSQLV